MNKKIFLAIAIAAVLGLGTFFFVNNNSDEETATVNQVASVPSSQQSETSQPANEVTAPEVEEIALLGVEGNTGSGTATRTVEGEYIHTVTAKVEDPAEGKFYEGWIVVNSNDFISTGELVKETEGEWSLTFTSSEDLSNYTNVVITEETSANGLDNIPEDHILEGAF
jgi:hypothetical protein